MAGRHEQRRLTPPEVAVAQEVARGRTNAQIAAVLEISVSSAKRHLAHVMLKWDCTNRTEVAVTAALAMERGLSMAEPLHGPLSSGGGGQTG